MSSLDSLVAPPDGARATPPPAHVGRAVALLAASMLLHWWVLGGMQRAADDMPAVSDRPARTVSAVLLAPPPPPPPVVRRPPRSPKVAPKTAAAPAPPPPIAASPAPAGEPAPTEAAPTEAAPTEAAPTEAAPTEAAPTEAAPPDDSEQPQGEPAPPPASEPATASEPAGAPEAASAQVQDAVLPAERLDGTDLAAELAETGVVAGGLPARATYVYLTKGSEYQVLTAETSVAWTLADDERYEARLATVALGITALELTSTGRLRRFGLAPERFVQKRIRRSPEAANFDWTERRVTFSARSFERALREGTQDRLSFQFQLMVLAQRLPERFRAGAAIEFPVAGPAGVDTYAFLVGDEETIATEVGDFVARKLERPRSVGGADSRIEVWLAPALQWLPVKLRFTDRRGRTTENVLLRIEDGSQPAPDAAR